MNSLQTGEGAEMVSYQDKLLQFLDQLLYAAFQYKKGTDYENLSMRGLVITEKEIDQAFGLLGRTDRLSVDELERLARSVEEIRAVELAAEGSGNPSAAGGIGLWELSRDFALTDMERLALLLGWAPSVNRKYEKIYGYLQDNIELTVPTRGLCVSLAELLGAADGEEKADFLAGAGNLELLIEQVGNGDGKGLSGAYRLSGRVRDHLGGSLELPVVLEKRCQIFSWAQELAPMEIRLDYLEQLCSLWEALEVSDRSCMILICGRKGIGKKFLVSQLAVRKKLRLLFFRLDELLYEKEEKLYKILDALLVESVLLRAQIVLTGADLERMDEEAALTRRQDSRKEILSYLEKHTDRFFLLSEEREEQTGDFGGRKISMELPSLTAGEKIRLWKSWGRDYPLDDKVDAEENGNKYILTPEGIRDVLDTAYLLAGTEGKGKISQHHIRQAVKQNQKNQLGEYAALINSRFTWDDLILGEEQKRQMRMVCDQMRFRDVVGEQWGFHKKTPYGRGLSVMFYGPPGTGKTMAAQVMANELGLDLYRIDISRMVSKYIGETQKNISTLFQKAKDINAVLFFDEADSLFAKRSEAKDSHDRNANAETAHLLQKLEDYEGITILATNYLNNIDDAFKRRLKFIIHIAFPDAQVRLRLWKATLPAEACCEEELDLEFFAERFELSGSSIKEILTNAAYMAAAEHRGMKNRDLMEAIKLNYAKYGKILTKNDFGYLG